MDFENRQKALDPGHCRGKEVLGGFRKRPCVRRGKRVKGFLEKEADGRSRQLPQCGKGRELLRGLVRALSAGLFKFFPIITFFKMTK